MSFGETRLGSEGESHAEHAERVIPKARLEIKAIDRTTDRQTAVMVDLTEQLAGKAALQEAPARIAERMLPRIVKP